MLGESCLTHPNKAQIDEMFNNGHTAEQVAAWLRQVQKDKRLRISKVSLQYYRKNFLKMSRLDINRKRNELLALGKHHDATALTTFTAAQDFIEAKNKQTEEVEKAIHEFKNIKDEVQVAIKLLKEQTVDAEGNPVFIPRHYEIMEKLLGRLESTNNSFIKTYSDLEKRNKESESSNTVININQAQQESEAIKNATKRILLEIDASKVGRYFQLLREESAKYAERNGITNLQININGSTEGETNINIITQLPTPEQENLDVENMSNENTTEHIVDVDVETPQSN